MRLRVNGRDQQLEVPATESLLATLRERLSLTGTKAACERGECGSCTVLVDGAPAYACLALTHGLDGRSVTTIEGLAPSAEGSNLHVVQEAFVRADAIQCGFCTPGQVLAVVALLERHPEPTNAQVAEAMSGNLCRCGTYPRIAEAIRLAVALRREGAKAAP